MRGVRWIIIIIIDLSTTRIAETKIFTAKSFSLTARASEREGENFYSEIFRDTNGFGLTTGCECCDYSVASAAREKFPGPMRMCVRYFTYHGADVIPPAAGCRRRLSEHTVCNVHVNQSFIVIILLSLFAQTY